MAATADLLVRVQGDTSDVNSKLGGLGKKLGGVGKLAVAGAGIAGAAVVGLGVKSVTSFASFDKGMREVFTLMPGISKKSMGAMEGDVLALSKKMGILPEDVIPALYDSISAGVPPDSVFEFLETASKTSIGGVTDLGTAVDAITSTVNAFGSENVSAAQASDLMFTAVKLGKTTMDELGRSLFQVNPIAAGLGVGFEDVTASLAVLTSQGVPTSVAATQMKSALSELGKTGSIADKTFRDIAGKGFADFISEGGNVEDALGLMKDAADESGVGITDFFGSVEAGQAALALTSETGAEAFSKAMEEMQNSAGATDDAFGTMDKGMARSWDKIKANASAAFVQIGSALAPFVERFMEWFLEVLPGAIEWFEGALQKVGPILQEIGAWLGEYVPKAAAALMAAFEAVWPVVQRVFETIYGAIKTVVDWFSGPEGSGKVGETTKGISKFFSDLFADIKPIWEKISKLISTAMELIKVVVDLALKGIQAFWEAHGERILEFVKRVWDSIRGGIEAALDVIQGVIDFVLGVLTGDWERAWDGILGIITGVWEGIKNSVGLALDALKLAIRLAIDGIKNLLSLAWNAIKTAASAGWTNAVNAIVGVVSTIWYKISSKISDVKTKLRQAWDNVKSTASEWFGKTVDAVVTALQKLPGRLGGVITTIKDKAIQMGKDFVRGIVNGLGGLYKGIYNKLKSAISNAMRAVGRFFGISSPSKVFEAEIGIPIAQGILGPQEEAIDLTKKLGGRISGLASPIDGSGSGSGSGLTIVVNGNLFGAATTSELAEILRNELGVQSLSGASYA